MLSEIFRKFGLSNLQLTFKTISIVFITDLYHKFHCFAFGNFTHMKTVLSLKYQVHSFTSHWLKQNSLSETCVSKFDEIIFMLEYWGG